MRHYKVETTFAANQEIRESLRWGTEKWGGAQSRQWVQGIRRAIASLSDFPERHPLAPESEEFSEPVRQMIYGRYRLLFNIRGNTVYVLHCRGAYTGTEDEPTPLQ